MRLSWQAAKDYNEFQTFLGIGGKSARPKMVSTESKCKEKTYSLQIAFRSKKQYLILAF
jgi:hypothetical protein